MTKNHTGERAHAPEIPPPPGFLISPKVGIAGLFIAFAVVGAAFLLAPLVLGKSVSETDATGPVATPPARLEHLSDSELAVQYPEEAILDLQSELRAWFASESRSAIFDDEAREEPEWVEHLLGEDVQPRMRRLPERVFEPLADPATALTDPAPLRGTLVAVWARVDRIDEASVLTPTGGRDVWRLGLTDSDGTPWVASITQPPPSKVEPGAWVRVVGTFTKTWPTDGGVALHVFSSRSPLASYPPVAHESPRIEWLEMVHDQDPRTSTTLEDEPLYGMLNYVRTLGLEGYREAVRSGDLELLDLTDTSGVTRLVDNPQAHRFAAVKMRLAMVRDEFVTDASLGENPGNIDRVYRGYLVDDQMRPVFWISPFPEDAFDVAEARVVEAEGFFLKRRMVEAGNGKSYWLPVIIGTDLRTVTKGELDIGVDLRWIVALVAAGSVAMFVVFAVAWRRTREAEEAGRRRAAERRQRRRERDGA